MAGVEAVLGFRAFRSQTFSVVHSSELGLELMLRMEGMRPIRTSQTQTQILTHDSSPEHRNLSVKDA